MYSEKARPLYALWLLLMILEISSLPSIPISIAAYLYPTSYLMFLVTFLFWAMIVVVVLVDLSRGGFSK